MYVKTNLTTIPKKSSVRNTVLGSEMTSELVNEILKRH